MNRLPITPDEMHDALMHLNTVLPKFGLTTGNTPTVVRSYRDALLPYDGEAVRGGAKLGTRTWDKFPTPKAWRDMISEWIRHNRIVQPQAEDVQRDGEGRAIICRTCRSVALTAWLRRADGSEYFRLIAPCDESRHHTGDQITRYPENFIEFAVQSLDVPTLALGRGAHLQLSAPR